MVDQPREHGGPMVAPVRLWNSKAWMTRQYVTLKLSPEEIAEKAGCGKTTIYRKLREFQLIK